MPDDLEKINGNEGSGRGAIFLGEVRCDGKFTPSQDELSSLLEKIDLVEKFKDVKYIEVKSWGSLVLSFDSVETSHLFALVLASELHKMGLSSTSPSDDFFTPSCLNDYRIDGGQLSYTEETTQDLGTEGILLQKYPDQEDRNILNKKEECIKKIISEVMPNISGELKDFTLKH